MQGFHENDNYHDNDNDNDFNRNSRIVPDQVILRQNCQTIRSDDSGSVG